MAVSVARFTTAAVTPGLRFSTRSTRVLQLAQVMPPTPKRISAAMVGLPGVGTPRQSRQEPGPRDGGQGPAITSGPGGQAEGIRRHGPESPRP